MRWICGLLYMWKVVQYWYFLFLTMIFLLALAISVPQKAKQMKSNVFRCQLLSMRELLAPLRVEQYFKLLIMYVTNFYLFSGHWQEEHPRRPNGSKQHHGINPNGHHIGSPLCRPSSSHKQHVQREETAKRRCLRSSRGVYGGAEIRDDLNDLPLLVFLPHIIN